MPLRAASRFKLTVSRLSLLVLHRENVSGLKNMSASDSHIFSRGISCFCASLDCILRAYPKYLAMATQLTTDQLHALETTGRVAAYFSVTGTIFAMLTSLFSPSFKKPINRLIFYASWRNLLCNVATLMSRSGIRTIQYSLLCQFQAVLIQR